MYLYHVDPSSVAEIPIWSGGVTPVSVLTLSERPQIKLLSLLGTVISIYTGSDQITERVVDQMSS